MTTLQTPKLTEAQKRIVISAIKNNFDGELDWDLFHKRGTPMHPLSKQECLDLCARIHYNVAGWKDFLCVLLLPRLPYRLAARKNGDVDGRFVRVLNNAIQAVADVLPGADKLQAALASAGQIEFAYAIMAHAQGVEYASPYTAAAAQSYEQCLDAYIPSTPSPVTPSFQVSWDNGNGACGTFPRRFSSHAQAAAFAAAWAAERNLTELGWGDDEVEAAGGSMCYTAEVVEAEA
jgi:hypothetical protein